MIQQSAGRGTRQVDSGSTSQENNLTTACIQEEIKPVSNETVDPAPMTEDAQTMDTELQKEVITRKPSSYASLVDPKEGTALVFIPPNEVNGRSFAKIEKEGVQNEIDYWANAVLCGVMGANPPFEVMDGFVHHIWKSMDIDKVLMFRKGVFLMRFNNLLDKMTVV